ncbi:MAG: winged helix-turn-helix transcriptional regulator [Acidobacteria bacterium]|nr:winged helix-turn-helix transcriptional regulator [Acidobacteriota bacterium]
MNTATARQLDDLFFALSDPTRRGILRELAKGEATVAQLSAPFPLAPSTMTKHLKVLERAGLIDRIPDGRHRRNRLRPRTLWGGLDWFEEMRQLWTEQLDSLEALLERERGRSKP